MNDAEIGRRLADAMNKHGPGTPEGQAALAKLLAIAPPPKGHAMRRPPHQVIIVDKFDVLKAEWRAQRRLAIVGVIMMAVAIVSALWFVLAGF